MPDVVCQVVLKNETDLPKDSAVNVLVFARDGDYAGLCQGIRDAYVGIGSLINGVYEGMEIRVYEWAASGPLGQPVYRENFTASFTGSQGPTEIAVCLSYATVDDPEASLPRRRGRIYLPVAVQSTLRPSDTIRDELLDFGEALAQIGFGTGTTWKMWSRRDGVTADIESIWVDNAWDVQRRRGLAPTNRRSRDVQ